MADEYKPSRMMKVYDWFGGKSTYFANKIFWAAVVLALLGKLTTEVVGLMAIVQALVTYRSVKQDEADNAAKNGNGAA